MENRINQVMTLENDKKLVVLHQAIYNNDNYYVCGALNEDETDVKDDAFILLHEIVENGKSSVELVEDEKLTEFILKHLNLID